MMKCLTTSTGRDPILKPTPRDENLPIAILMEESLKNFNPENLPPLAGEITEEEYQLSVENPQIEQLQ